MKFIKKTLLILFMNTAVTLQMVSIAQAQSPAPVIVTKVEERTLQKPITLVGDVEPIKSSLIASEIPGIVESYPVKEGDFVKKGDVISELRTNVLNIRVTEAKDAAREAEARYQLAQQNLARLTKLHEKGVASRQQLDGALSERDAWSARKAMFQDQLKKQQYDLEVSKILAPFNGYITRKETEVGQWIVEGGPVAELIDIDKVDITVDVPEHYISRIKRGDIATINFDAVPGVLVEGEITSIVPQADESARTFPVKVEIPNENHLIRSGMVARVSFLIGQPTVVKLVPKDAIVEQNRNNIVYVVNNGSAHPVQVNRGMSYKDQIEVIGPIETGQLVVIRGNERLQPGQPVKIVNEDNIPSKNKFQ